MLNPFLALGKALRDLSDEFLLLIICNLLWAALCMPLWMSALFLLGADAGLPAFATVLLGVLPAGPATAGLFAVAARVVDGRATTVGHFFSGMRTYARPAWVIVGVATLGLVLIGYNLIFYLRIANWFGASMLGLCFYGLIFWLSLLFYAPALLVLQTAPSLRSVARNAFLMGIGRPVFTLLNLALLALLLVLSFVLMLPLFMVTVALFALWSIHAARLLGEDARSRRQSAQPIAAPPPEEHGRKGQARPE